VFDPLATSSSDDDDESVWGELIQTFSRRNVSCPLSFGCGCGLCEVMGSATENLCCHSIQKVREKIPTSEICITVHPTFLGGVLNQHAIEIAYFNLMEHEREAINAPDLHRRYRLTAYNQFVRWVWHKLGRHHRKPLPSCVVVKIRAAYPSETYTGFRYVEY
ncbi:uncharacterized protein LOC121048631, partial [Ixodes scapularis]|uniref:uncharacterized protein LOC121048631 n=1 Tax=Ixodes scapularis TaxID=6945 RepID=UPI001C38E059